MITPDQLRAYLIVMREHGATRFEHEGLLIEAAPAAPRQHDSLVVDIPKHPDGRPWSDEDWALGMPAQIPPQPARSES